MMQQEAANEQQTAEGERLGYSGGRMEPSVGAAEVAVDVSSSYPVILTPTEGVGDGAKSAGGDLSPEDASLPPVPEGAVLGALPDAAVVSVVTGEEASDSALEGAQELPAIRFIGESAEEFDLPVEDGPLSFESVILALVDAALESEKEGGAPLTGQAVAQIFCRGDVQDGRVEFLLLLLAQDRPIDGALVLAAAKATEGLEELVERAVVEREELDRASDVSVEQMNSAGLFVPLEAARAATSGEAAS